MRYYETLYIINPNLTDEDYREVVAKFAGIVEKNNGVVTRVHEWGKKALAYEVRKQDKGYYVLLRYCGDSGITNELNRDLKLDDRVLKYQTIKLSDHADPEAIKAKAEQEDGRMFGDEATLEEISLEEEEEIGRDSEVENGIQ
jgi:small subunit ribosomal protein S6